MPEKVLVGTFLAEKQGIAVARGGTSLPGPKGTFLIYASSLLFSRARSRNNRFILLSLSLNWI